MRNADYERVLVLIENLAVLKDESIIPVLEDAITTDTLILQAYITLQYENECCNIRERITETKVLLSFFYLRALSGKVS